jgi:hypothetical protein
MAAEQSCKVSPPTNCLYKVGFTAQASGKCIFKAILVATLAHFTNQGYFIVLKSQ